MHVRDCVSYEESCLIHAKERKKKKNSAAKQKPATLEGVRALAFSMRAPPRFDDLTSSDSSKQLR